MGLLLLLLVAAGVHGRRKYPEKVSSVTSVSGESRRCLHDEASLVSVQAVTSLELQVRGVDGESHLSVVWSVGWCFRDSLLPTDLRGILPMLVCIGRPAEE